MDNIDAAFNQALQEFLEEINEGRPIKRRKAVMEAEEAGGFLLDEEEDGGSMSITSEGQTADELPLSFIPRALQLLDLPPEDPEVMEVFKSAAYQRKADYDWNNFPNDEVSNRVVSKEDWRKVCSTLLLDSADELSIDGSGSDTSSSSVPGTDNDDSADEYTLETTKRKRKTGRVTGTRQPRKRESESYSKDTPTGDGVRMGGTKRQKKDAMATFALFFSDLLPDENDDFSGTDLIHRKITIDIVAKAAKSIKEKISADEIIEMLNIFNSASSVKNASLSFEEFQQLLLDAKLV